MICLKLVNIVFLMTSVCELNGRNISRTFLAREVDITEVPFIVLVINSKGSSCTGFLIDKTWVLTAAHCFLNTTKGCSVILGANDKKYTFNEQLAKRVIVHPQFNLLTPQGAGFDIALIQLRRSIMRSPKINIIPIEVDSWLPEYGKRNCFVVGYGYHYHLKRSGRLHGAQVSVARGEYPLTCVHANIEVEPYYWSYSNESEPLCFGDSGAPLVCDRMATGVAAASYPCGDSLYNIDCSETYVDVYVVINHHLDWLKEYVPCLPTCAAVRLIRYNTKLLCILVSINAFIFR